MNEEQTIETGQVEEFNETTPEVDQEVVEEGQAEEQAPEENQPQTEEVNDTPDYEAKIWKMSEDYQALKAKYDTALNQHRDEFGNLQSELEVYQNYYNENDKLLEALNNNPELLEQVRSQLPDETFSRDDVANMVQEQLKSEFQKQQETAAFESTLDSWADKNKDVPAPILEKVYAEIDSMNVAWLSNEQIVREMDKALALETISHQKALWAKEEQLRQQKVAQATVWWWVSQSTPEQTQAPQSFFWKSQWNPYQGL